MWFGHDVAIAVTPQGSKVFSRVDGGRHWLVVSPNVLPSGVPELDFVSEGVGWARVQVSGCRAFKEDCYTYQVYQTADGGQTWKRLDLLAATAPQSRQPHSPVR
jgi:photosystem II stability/assembly factor-like uncharacterized protein